MTIDQQITHAAARVAVAVSNGEEDQVKQWEAEVERLMDQRDRLADSIARLEARDDFDVLKGHPDHSGLSHA
jgi:ubiquinone biosynthesis protein UbiJ